MKKILLCAIVLLAGCQRSPTSPQNPIAPGSVPISGKARAIAGYIDVNTFEANAGYLTVQLKSIEPDHEAYVYVQIGVPIAGGGCGINRQLNLLRLPAPFDTFTRELETAMKYCIAVSNPNTSETAVDLSYTIMLSHQ